MICHGHQIWLWWHIFTILLGFNFGTWKPWCLKPLVDFNQAAPLTTKVRVMSPAPGVWYLDVARYFTKELGTTTLGRFLITNWGMAKTNVTRVFFEDQKTDSSREDWDLGEKHSHQKKRVKTRKSAALPCKFKLPGLCTPNLQEFHHLSSVAPGQSTATSWLSWWSQRTVAFEIAFDSSEKKWLGCQLILSGPRLES